MRRFFVFPLAVAAIVIAGEPRTASTISASIVEPLMQATQPEEMCLMPQVSYAQRAGAGGGGVPDDWPGRGVRGGDVPPLRMVRDQYPTFDGIAIDAKNGLLAFSDENLGGLLLYDTSAGSQSTETTTPKRHVFGAKVGLGYIAGVALDPIDRQVVAINNDGGGLVVHAYDAHGDVPPVRKLSPPHQSWGLSLDFEHDELAITSQQYQGISFFKRSAKGADRPVRTIRGMQSGLADPHGVYVDPQTDEVFTTNHGNWTEMRSYSADGPPVLPGEYIPGRFEQASILVHTASANGNVPPKRRIQGAQTRLNWPMGVAMDTAAGELAVANYGTNEVLFFKKGSGGDTAPTRVLGGDRTGIAGPIGVVVDDVRNEIWVANYGDHTAVVFDRGASGNVAPKRIIRNAPAGTPTTGFTNAASAAYDTKRDELLVPN